MRSLILSRLLHKVHTLTMSVAGLRKLNAPYMRVLRSISDVDVRRMVVQPSIDSLVLQKRLA